MYIFNKNKNLTQAKSSINRSFQLVPRIFGLVGFALYKETSFCVEKLGEKYKNPVLKRDPHFTPVCIHKKCNIY